MKDYQEISAFLLPLYAQKFEDGYFQLILTLFPEKRTYFLSNEPTIEIYALSYYTLFMSSKQTPQISKKPLLLLVLLLFVFIIKGVVLTVLFPFFQGPDEQVHYATIQHLAEPPEKNWPIIQIKKQVNTSDIQTFNFSEETIQSAQATEFDEVKFQKENTQKFSQSAIGFNESKILNNQWKQYIDIYPPNTSGTTSLYYFLNTNIEQFLSDQSILTRFFWTRFLSVAFGVLVVLLTYLTARTIGFSEYNSLIIGTLVAFQPMFSATAAIVNIDIALIFSFSLFIYAAISLLEAHWRWLYIALLLIGIVFGLFSKGPGIVLVVCAVPLLIYISYHSLHILHIRKQKFVWLICSLLILCLGLTLALVPKSYFVSIINTNTTSKFDSPFISLGKYINKTVSSHGLSITHTSYWGNFGWLDTTMSNVVIKSIWTIELIAFLGIMMYLISGSGIIRRPTNWIHKKDFLPEKKYILFFIGIIIALQLAIRFYDWRVFDATGKILIGTPGRYFLPNIIPHIFLLVTGLGFFTQNKKQFTFLLKTLFILMVLLSLYAIFNVILPRYYL